MSIIKVNPYFYNNFTKFLKREYMKHLGDVKVELSRGVKAKFGRDPLTKEQIQLIKDWKHPEMLKRTLPNGHISDEDKRGIIKVMTSSTNTFDISVGTIISVYKGTQINKIEEILKSENLNISSSWYTEKDLNNMIKMLNINKNNITNYPSIWDSLSSMDEQNDLHNLKDISQYLLVKTGKMKISRYNIKQEAVFKILLKQDSVEEIVKTFGKAQSSTGKISVFEDCYYKLPPEIKEKFKDKLKKILNVCLKEVFPTLIT